MKRLFDDMTEFQQWMLVHSPELIGVHVKEIIAKNEEPGEFDVSFVVNGYSVDFSKFVDLIEEQLDTLVERKARELVKDEIEETKGKILDAIDDAVFEIRFGAEFDEED